MDNEFEELESELKQLYPAAPPGALAERIEKALVQTPQRGRPALPWLVFPVAAAAMIALALSQRISSQSTQTPAPSFKPVAAENLLLDAIDEGYTTHADGTPARRVRQSYLDTITWKDSRTNASLTWSLPREEVRVVPVFFQ